jgi:hypothetical protein
LNVNEETPTLLLFVNITLFLPASSSKKNGSFVQLGKTDFFLYINGKFPPTFALKSPLKNSPGQANRNNIKHFTCLPAHKSGAN